MIFLVDKKNKEVIQITGTKGSKYLMNNLESLSLNIVVEVHSSQTAKVNLTSLGFNEIISATKYCEKYNIKV